MVVESIGPSPSMHKRALILAFTNLRDDPRVQRQIQCLRQHFDLTVLGAQAPGTPDVRYLHAAGTVTALPRTAVSCLQRFSGRFEAAYWTSSHIRYCLKVLMRERFDVIIANDILTLPLALRTAKGARVVFDAHEYSPGEFENSLLWRVFDRALHTHLCRRYMARADATLTVCESIARAYADSFGVYPKVMSNAPYYRELLPGPVHRNIRMIHHGLAHPSRKLERTIDMMRLLDSRFSLDFILVPGELTYMAKLKTRAAHLPSVRFLPSVPMDTLPEFINQYDIGLAALAPTSFNLRYALPNKFFEYIQGRVAVVTGPSPEMARIVRKHDIGVIAKDFTASALAEAVKGLNTETLWAMKHNTNEAARKHCAENNVSLLYEAVKLVRDQDDSDAKIPA